MAVRIPQAFAAPSKLQASSDTSKTVTAKIDMSAEVAGQGLCPDCQSPMEEVFLDEDPVISCIPCRIVLPIKDAETVDEATDGDASKLPPLSLTI